MGKNDRIIKEHPEYIINLVDVFRSLDPSSTGKFVPFIMKQFNDKVNNTTLSDNEADQIIKAISPDASNIEKYVLMILYHTLGKDNLFALWEFEKHLTANRVEEKDIQKYKNWDDIINATMMADLKVKEKELRKQIITLFDDDEWLVLKPLSFQASLAYGANTRWCTASRNNENYFYDYTSRGVLVYVINRKSADKCAMFIDINPKKFKKGTEISFWNAEDSKVESLSLDLPEHIMDVLRQQINDKTQMKPNRYFFTVDEIKKSSPERRSNLIEPMVIEDQHEIEEGEEEAPAEMEMAEGNPREPVDMVEVDWDVNEEHLVPRGQRNNRIAPMPEPAGVRDRPHILIGINGEQAQQRIGRMNRVVLNEVAEREMDEDAEELRLELTNEAMLEVAEEMATYHDEDKSENVCQVGFILGPNVPVVDAPIHFEPAPWLTQTEIDVVNRLIDPSGKEKLRAGCDVNHYAYPDGRVIEVFDDIKRNVIVRRIIREIRIGRSEETKFNPFSIISEPVLETLQGDMHIEMEPMGEAEAYAVEDRVEMPPPQQGGMMTVER